MADLISREALLKECAECQKTDPHFEGRGWASHFISDAGEPSTEWYCVEDMIENAPAVDAAPVIHAHWSFKGTAYGCSNCGHGAIIPGANYCEECGAKMDEALSDGMSVKGIAPDKVEVVRCKDCKYWNECDDKTSGTCNNVGGLWDAWEFCSDGERRDSE